MGASKCGVSQISARVGEAEVVRVHSPRRSARALLHTSQNLRYTFRNVRYTLRNLRYTLRKLHSLENGIRLISTARSLSTTNRSLGLIPIPFFASYSPGSTEKVIPSSITE